MVLSVVYLFLILFLTPFKCYILLFFQPLSTFPAFVNGVICSTCVLVPSYPSCILFLSLVLCVYIPLEFLCSLFVSPACAIKVLSGWFLYVSFVFCCPLHKLVPRFHINPFITMTVSVISDCPRIRADRMHCKKLFIITYINL